MEGPGLAWISIVTLLLTVFLTTPAAPDSTRATLYRPARNCVPSGRATLRKDLPRCPGHVQQACLPQLRGDLHHIASEKAPCRPKRCGCGSASLWPLGGASWGGFRHASQEYHDMPTLGKEHVINFPHLLTLHLLMSHFVAVRSTKGHTAERCQPAILIPLRPEFN